MRSYWDEDLAILSSENVSFSLETAGLGSRLAALSVDTAIQMLVVIAGLIAVAGLEYYLGLSNYIPPFWESVGEAILIILGFLLFFGYYFFFEWRWDGQTPGKRYFGLRVTMADGLPLTLWPAMIRNIVRVVDFLPLFYGFGAILCLSNNLNQRGGDLAAGTIVVVEGKREKARKTLTMREAVDSFLQAATTIPGTQTSTPYQDEELQVEAARSVDPDAIALARVLSREDYELARDFLTRRETLPTVARERLAKSLALRLATKMKVETPADPETFIADVVAMLTRAYAG